MSEGAEAEREPPSLPSLWWCWWCPRCPHRCGWCRPCCWCPRCPCRRGGGGAAPAAGVPAAVAVVPVTFIH